MSESHQVIDNSNTTIISFESYKVLIEETDAFRIDFLNNLPGTNSSTIDVDDNNYQNSLMKLGTINPLLLAKELVRLYFRLLNLNKRSAYPHFYFRYMKSINSLSKKDKLPELVLTLVNEYQSKLKWTFTLSRKQKLQKDILDLIK